MADRIEIYDILLACALVGAAWKALLGREAFTSTVFFVVYGLLMSISWVQLGAVDVALAEACIGAGLTGALLIGAIRQFEPDPDIHSPNHRSLGWRTLAMGLSMAVFFGLLAATTVLVHPLVPIPELVEKNLSLSGTTHPVTAVLLNFRAFDTWLELGVLLLASIAAMVIHQIYDDVPIPERVPSEQGQPRIIGKLMFPLLILVGGVVLWFGSRAPGGAFQAGALLGAAGILLQIGGERSLLKVPSPSLRFFLTLGFVSFLLTAGFTFATGRRILEYSPSLAGTMILVIELAATLSIALTLNVMYACSHPWRARR